MFFEYQQYAFCSYSSHQSFHDKLHQNSHKNCITFHVIAVDPSALYVLPIVCQNVANGLFPLYSPLYLQC